METMYYTLTAREILVEGAAMQRASGDGARQLVCVRKAAQSEPAGGKVIDLAAWKADREEEARLEELWYGDVAAEAFDPEYEEAAASETEYVRRERRSHKAAQRLELISCAAVIAVMAALVIRVWFGF